MKLINLDFEDKVKDNHSFKSLQKLELPNKSIEEFKHFDLSDLYTYNYNLNYHSYCSMEQFEYLKNENFYYIFISDSKFMSNHSSITEHITFETLKKNSSKFKNPLYLLSEIFIKQQNQISITKDLNKPLSALGNILLST